MRQVLTSLSIFLASRVFRRTSISKYSPSRRALQALSRIEFWRDSIWHLAASATWTRNSTVIEMKGLVAQRRDFSKAKMDLAPGSATYFYENILWPSSWQDNYWQGNYVRLVDVKQAVDPWDLLECCRSVRWGKLFEALSQDSCAGNLDSLWRDNDTTVSCRGHTSWNRE